MFRLSPWRLILLPVLLFSCARATLAEDNVLTTIREATRQYRAGEYTEAASNLDYAAQLVRQRKSETLKELLPEAPPGWIAGEPEAQALGTAILGGAVTVSRDYKKGAASVTVEIVSDSPLLQSVLMMIKNPMFAGAGGGALETLKGQPAIIKYDAGRGGGELYIVVDSRFIVSIKGREIDRADLLAFADLIDYGAYPPVFRTKVVSPL